MNDRIRSLVLLAAWLAACFGISLWAHRFSYDENRLAVERVELPPLLCEHRTVIRLENGRERVLAAAPARCAERAP